MNTKTLVIVTLVALATLAAFVATTWHLFFHQM
jgi:hypothetical protein